MTDTLPVVPAALSGDRGRIGDSRPVAVIDIGSNSVRLVVYERHARALVPMHNEKKMCGLGRGVGQTGSLCRETVDQALASLRRFSRVCELNNVEVVHVFATAAVREASNGADFIEDIEAVTGIGVHVLSGEDEAFYAALGIVAGMPDRSGVIGDFGGGSLELAVVDKAGVSGCQSFELGAIRLQTDSEESPARAYQIARARLTGPDCTHMRRWPTFIAVGGSWRALARIYQLENDYLLHMVHDYAVEAAAMIDFCTRVIDLAESGKFSPYARQLSSNRRDLSGYGAAALRAVLEVGHFQTVTFSSCGVREGYLFDRLPAKEKRKDPLLQCCEVLSIMHARSHTHTQELIVASDQFMAAVGYDECAGFRRLRHAACYLSDIAWRWNPVHRGSRLVNMVLFDTLAGIDHPGRAHLARLLAVRYAGVGKRRLLVRDPILDQCGAAHARHADITGLFFRFAYQISAAMPGVLAGTGWSVIDGQLKLTVSAGTGMLVTDKVVRRLVRLASLLNLAAGVAAPDE